MLGFCFCIRKKVMILNYVFRQSLSGKVFASESRLYYTYPRLQFTVLANETESNSV